MYETEKKVLGRDYVPNPEGKNQTNAEPKNGEGNSFKKEGDGNGKRLDYHSDNLTSSSDKEKTIEKLGKKTGVSPATISRDSKFYKAMKTIR